MATLYDVDVLHYAAVGATLIKELVVTVEPKNGTDFNLDELYELLRCQTIEIITLRDGRMMIIDEEGKLADPPRPVNRDATALAKDVLWPDDYISGPALVCKGSEVK